MKCKQCGEELNEKWTVCPFCGLEISKEQSLGDILLKMIEENGPEIFEEENAGLLKNQMDQWPESFSDDRDVIKLLQIKHIPEQLVKALEMPSEKQAQVLQYATSTLTDKFGINGNMAQKMLALVAGSIGFQINDQVPSIVSIFANADSENTFTDPRDDQVYRTVKIGDQVWMAENLNYAMSGSYCYEKNKENAEKYGRLYIWEAAQKAPPPGWHLPSNEEWNQLFEYVGGTEVAGNQLKSKNGWKDDGNGIDRHGFSVLPAGQVISSDTYLNCGIEAIFWSSTVYGRGRDKATFLISAVYGEYAYSRIFNNNNDGAMADYNSINNGYSVRCIKDSE